MRVPRQSFLYVRAKLLAEVAALEAPAHAKGLELPPVDCDAILPLVEKARWSSDLDVKRDAVAGIASLAANRENQEAIGRMGGLQAVAHIVLGDASGKALPLSRIPTSVEGTQMVERWLLRGEVAME